ncbi:hypothetical protein AGR7C_Lc120054 [Agrobacterium deltaense Zutra 3/1]|uniref:Uncharacterized protein n=1 Tax=Agrobacterium deltaense Zutra 3/1 TaxID=1183427 RepID=A0A1S7R337_9HYPH|nr:hypothetical protein AGR7C_Lc120054 [Agrobacterium deltaense Zutra 3/1]
MTSFGDAFKAARTAGKTTFKWQGKSYHTKTKEEMEKTKKTYSVPTPAPRPSNETASGAELPTSKPTSTAMSRNIVALTAINRHGAPGLDLVEQRPAPHDARITVLQLTGKGRTFLERLLSVWRRGDIEVRV